MCVLSLTCRFSKQKIVRKRQEPQGTRPPSTNTWTRTRCGPFPTFFHYAGNRTNGRVENGNSNTNGNNHGGGSNAATSEPSAFATRITTVRLLLLYIAEQLHCAAARKVKLQRLVQLRHVTSPNVTTGPMARPCVLRPNIQAAEALAELLQQGLRLWPPLNPTKRGAAFAASTDMENACRRRAFPVGLRTEQCWSVSVNCSRTH